MRAQWGPAIVVEKSMTRRPAKHPVKRPSSASAVVIPSSPSAASFPVDPKGQRWDREEYLGTSDAALNF
jgi:hypothetical protein